MLEDSASNVLFHPPAAHEEHSADSAGDDSAIIIGESPKINSQPVNENNEEPDDDLSFHESE